jgi:hypothetical protein
MTDTLKEHLRKAGSKGGKAAGQSKVRGDTDYYKRISKKAAAARKAKRNADSGTGSKK